MKLLFSDMKERKEKKERGREKEEKKTHQQQENQKEGETSPRRQGGRLRLLPDGKKG